VADIEGEQGLALLSDGGDEDRQVLVVSLAAERVFVFPLQRRRPSGPPPPQEA